MTENTTLQLFQTLAARFGTLPQVRAVVMAGSLTAGFSDKQSDLDVYVYADSEVPLDFRRALVEELGAGSEQPPQLDNHFWDTNDEWSVASGLHVDTILRSPDWIEDQLDRVLVRHEVSLGYTTAFWHNVLTSTIGYERDGWFTALKARAAIPYPPELQRAIIAKNYPVLRWVHSSYRQQIELAVLRQDRISVNHRVAALFASYFDVLFAANALPNPGEKRLVQRTFQYCQHVPQDLDKHVDYITVSTALLWDVSLILGYVDALLDGLDALLEQLGLLPEL